MIVRSLSLALVVTSLLLGSAAAQRTDHLDFNLVYGTAGFVPSGPNGEMSIAPHTVLAFSIENGHKNLVLTDSNGDYTAALEPGHYCLTAYSIKTGDRIRLDKRQLKCIDVVHGKDVRLDVMLRSQTETH